MIDERTEREREGSKKSCSVLISCASGWRRWTAIWLGLAACQKLKAGAVALLARVGLARVLQLSTRKEDTLRHTGIHWYGLIIGCSEYKCHQHVDCDILFPCFCQRNTRDSKASIRWICGRRYNEWWNKYSYVD